MNLNPIWLAGCLAMCFASHAQARADIEAGEAKSRPCQACHGADGNGAGDPTVPLIAGQHADYLSRSLRDYRAGIRNDPIMVGFASTLSDADIEDLAAYYAAQSGPLRDMRGTR